ncbi:MAG: LytR/AlgR family response regulator transcription factor [Bacteroidales bacterium]
MKRFNLHASISLGLFLFFLFFQPLPVHFEDTNNGLIFMAGFGAIAFIFLVTIDGFLFNQDHSYNGVVNRTRESYLAGLTILALSSVAFAFYARYVGNVAINFPLMIRIIFICAIPPVILQVDRIVKDMKMEIERLSADIKVLKKEFNNHQQDSLNKTIEFVSENKSENLKVRLSDIACIKSADNYVEIFYLDNARSTKRLIRKTLRNVEEQLWPFDNFIRCHRACIVNLHFIERLIRKYGNYIIRVRGFEETIPVSRQYILKLKDAISEGQGRMSTTS